jgi:hypothetical protein
MLQRKNQTVIRFNLIGSWSRRCKSADGRQATFPHCRDGFRSGEIHEPEVRTEQAADTEQFGAGGECVGGEADEQR